MRSAADSARGAHPTTSLDSVHDRAVAAMNGLVVTVDLFSALLDSRRGGTAALGELSQGHGLEGTDPQVLFDHWDAENKRLHQEQAGSSSWLSFRELAAEAMSRTYRQLQLSGDPGSAVTLLLDSIPRWPAWPDSIEGLGRLAEVADVGILSNVDADLLAQTVVTAHVDPRQLYSSERLRAYKPSRSIYRLTQQAVRASGKGLLHVASSARDVWGAARSGIDLVHLRREGIPQPGNTLGVATVTTLIEVADRVRERETNEG